nr:hypothetical protein [Bordetella genomosp. 1]
MLREPQNGAHHRAHLVSTSKDRIEQAKDEWTRTRFDQIVPGDESEFIPLPAVKG